MGDYSREGLEGILRGKYGGNRRNLSQEAEEALLAPFLTMAEKGRILIVSDIHKAYETTVDHTVPPSMVYRMLGQARLAKSDAPASSSQSEPGRAGSV